jgi:hypothetical protein
MGQSMKHHLHAAGRSTFRWELFANATVWASSILMLMAIASVYLGQTPEELTSQKEQAVRHAQAR